MNLIPTEKRIARRTVNTRYERSASMDKALKGFVSHIVGLGTVLMMPRRLIVKREMPNQQAHQSSDFVRAIKLVFRGINYHPHTEYFGFLFINSRARALYAENVGYLILVRA
jgi:hypothetical protein